MKTKMIILPIWGAKVLRVVSYVVVIVLDTTVLLLAPIAWMRFRAHLTAFVGSVIAWGYWYITGVENAVLKASGCFIAFVLIVAFIKLLEKRLHKVARRFDEYILGLLPVCVYVRVPSFLKRKREKEVKQWEKLLHFATRKAE